MAAKKTPVSKLSFSEAVDEVEAIVARLENEQTDVDELAGEVERAVELISACRERLDRTDGEVRELVAKLEAVAAPDATAGDDDADDDAATLAAPTPTPACRSDMAPLITVDRLTKDYRLTDRREGVLGGFVDLVRPRKRTLRAVEDVSFTIDAGEMVGYIGANGAGKSTTIKMLTGILTPTSGEVSRGRPGALPAAAELHPAHRRGLRPAHAAVVGPRGGRELPPAAAHLRGAEDPVPRAHGLLRRAPGNLEFLRQPVRKLSLGQRMRCDLAAALLHEPQVLFLDEPTIGLDVVAKENVRTFLRQAREQLGVTVILTTHDLSDIEQLCRRIIIIDRGKVLYNGLLDDLRRGPGHRLRLCLDLAEPASARALAAATADLPVEWTAAAGEQDAPSLRHCALFSRAETSAGVILTAVLAAHRLRDMALTEPAIEDVVRRIYREGLEAAR